MRKAIMCIAVAIAMLCAHHAYAISLADSCKASGVKQSNTHQHITTGPCVVYGLKITATANDGFACLVQTTGPEAYPESVSMVGQHYYTNTANRVLADPREATANNTVYLDWPQGLACAGGLFLDCAAANAEVYYRE